MLVKLLQSWRHSRWCSALYKFQHWRIRHWTSLRLLSNQFG